MKNTLFYPKNLFCSLDIQNFLLPSSIFFFSSRPLLRQNPKVYDIIICPNWDLKTKFLISWEVKRSNNETCWIHRVLYEEIFHGNSVHKFLHQKLFPDLYLILANAKKYSQCMKEILLKEDILKRNHQKKFQKNLLMKINMKNKRNLELVTKSSSGY